jgi:hypothetical protein
MTLGLVGLATTADSSKYRLKRMKWGSGQFEVQKTLD